MKTSSLMFSHSAKTLLSNNEEYNNKKDKIKMTFDMKKTLYS